MANTREQSTSTANRNANGADPRKAKRSMVREKVTGALDKGRDAATRGVTKSKELATMAKEKSTQTLDSNPMALVMGGVAIGAILGALVPRTETETKVLGKAGKKLNKKARKMASAAKDAGKAKVDSLGLGGEAMRFQVRELFGKATEAFQAAGRAASEEARRKN